MTMADRMVVMCDGRAQQVDAPLRVYARPVNRFVASFIGSPPMNFFEGHVHCEGAVATFREDGAAEGGFCMPITGAAVEHGAAVVLGVRPGAFSAATADSPGSGPGITMSIEHVEPLGDVTDLRGRTAGGHAIIARLPARDDGPWTGMMRLTVDQTRVHLFEPGPLGRALALRLEESRS